MAMEIYEVALSSGVEATVLSAANEVASWTGVEVVVSSGNAQFYVDPVHTKFVKMASTDAPKQFWHVDGITKVVAKGDGGAATIRVYPISKG